MSEQHTDGSKPPEKLCCRASNNETKARRAVIKGITVSFRNYLYFLLCTWTKQHWHGTETMRDKSKIILQILKYRRMFQDWCSGINPAVRQCPWAGEPVTAGPHNHCWQQFLGCCSLGKWRCQEMFLTEPTTAVPPLPNLPLKYNLMSNSTSYSLMSNSSCRSLHEAAKSTGFCEELVCLGWKGWTQGLWCPRMLI